MSASSITKHGNNNTPYDYAGNYLAKQRRQKHDNSKKVFVKPRGRQSEAYKSQYTLQFNKKIKGRPSSPRPCSPTRRNNPHPSQNFLSWRIPTRVFDYGKNKEVNVGFLKSNVADTYQSFYDDYSGKPKHESDSGKLSDINTNMLLEFAKSYGIAASKEDRRKHTIMSPLSELTEKLRAGCSTPTILQRIWSPTETPEALLKRRPKKVLSPLPQAVQSFDTENFFRDWFETMKKGEEFPPSEDELIKTVLESTLQPDAAEVFQTWLKELNGDEREIALQFFQAMLIASSREDKVGFSKFPGPPKKERSAPKKLYHLAKKGVDGVKKGSAGGSGHHHKHLVKGCNLCKKMQLEGALQKLQDVANMSFNEVPAITDLLNPLHPDVVIEQELQKQLKERKLQRGRRCRFQANKGSLFMVSKKHGGRYFTIHPEWQ